jgi:glycerate kinase
MDAQLSVVIAPDSFKGSLSAADVAAAIARGWAGVRPDDRLTTLPQADGGEGTLDAIAAAVPDAVRHHAGPVTGPDGRLVPGAWLELPGRVGVVELAQCSGLPLMAALDPLGATTRGLGEVIRHALDAGMTSFVVGLGGSASTDGGAGALSALGLRLLDGRGRPLPDGGGALVGLGSIDRDDLAPPPQGGVALLTDVTAPLLGPSGAAATFGPQKGADAADICVLEAGLARFASLLGGHPDAPGSGAAGGTAYGLAAAWGARIERGAQVLQRLTGLTDALGSADVVLSGEGRFDATSTTGKVVGEVLALARERGVRAGVVAGQVATGADAADSDSWTCSLSELAGSAEEAIADPVRYLERAGREAAGCFGGEG